MKELILINGKKVEFEVVGDQTYTTSKDIALVFGQEHKNIITKIRELPQDEFNRLNFKPISYVDNRNRRQPMFKLTRDGFSLLVMGFTGEKAYRWKVQFIEAFNKMEALLKSHFHPQGLEQIILKQNEILATLSDKIGTLQEDLLFAYKQTISAQKQTIEAKPPHYNTWLTPHEADMIVRLKRDGHSLAHIQRTLQRSDFVVRRVLKEAGMYTPPYRVVHVIEEA